MNKYSENLWALQKTNGTFVSESVVFGAASINKDLPALYYSREAAREARTSLPFNVKVVKTQVYIKAA